MQTRRRNEWRRWIHKKQGIFTAFLPVHRAQVYCAHDAMPSLRAAAYLCFSRVIPKPMPLKPFQIYTCNMVWISSRMKCEHVPNHVEMCNITPCSRRRVWSTIHPCVHYLTHCTTTSIVTATLFFYAATPKFKHAHVWSNLWLPQKRFQQLV